MFLGLLIYIGRKRNHTLIGKMCFWIGAVFLIFLISSMMVVQFAIGAALILFLRYYANTKKHPPKWEPSFYEGDSLEEPLLKTTPLLQHKFLGDQVTSEAGYKWHDVNIQGGFGDRILDLSNTVLPEDVFISIRHVVGNIEIYVPYEVEVSVHHSAMFGNVGLLGEVSRKITNQTIAYHTPLYYEKKPRIKIITSTISGDIEVKRL